MSRIAIVAAEFNPAILNPMVAFAHEEATALGLVVEREVRVPGSFEIPLVTSALLARGKIDAVCVLGYLEKGETLHGEVLGHVVYRALVDLQLAHGKPVGLGIIGPGATHPQAETRREGHARSAVRAIAAQLANLDAIAEKKAAKVEAKADVTKDKAEKAMKKAAKAEKKAAKKAAKVAK